MRDRKITIAKICAMDDSKQVRIEIGHSNKRVSLSLLAVEVKDGILSWLPFSGSEFIPVAPMPRYSAKKLQALADNIADTHLDQIRAAYVRLANKPEYCDWGLPRFDDAVGTVRS